MFTNVNNIISIAILTLTQILLFFTIAILFLSHLGFGHYFDVEME